MEQLPYSTLVPGEVAHGLIKALCKESFLNACCSPKMFLFLDASLKCERRQN